MWGFYSYYLGEKNEKIKLNDASIKKTINIGASILIFVLVIAAFAIEKYFGSANYGFFDIDQTKVTIRWAVAAPYFALLIVAAALACAKFCLITLWTYPEIKKNKTTLILFVLEIINFVVILLAAFAIFMHGKTITDVAGGMKIYMSPKVLSWMALAFATITGYFNYKLSLRPNLFEGK